MSKYYIIDESCGLYEEERETEMSEEEFYDSLDYNYTVAEEYGDDLPDYDELVENFEKNETYEESINNFTYRKEEEKNKINKVE